MCEKAVIRVSGKNNRLVLGNNVHLGRVTFDFRGDNNVVEIEDNVLLRGSILVHEGSRIRIGAGTKFHFNAVLEAREATTIDMGKGCLISQVRLTTCDVHSVFDLETGARINRSRDIKLHDHVWLAYDVMVCKGSEIGPDSVVGAKALVAGKFPANCVIGGNPANVIRKGITWDHRSLDRLPDHDGAPSLRGSVAA
ncbi:Galactoside O-acetyltransferase [compost metagenome]